ncbi:MAG: tetratricopeptide repeat protein [Selenomonadaceae bacterium]|nr:tetratricopeptide repeat protein [Selenomonadaceae bacterium]
MKNFLTAIVATLFLLTAVAHAEIQVYDGEGTYVMSEGENLGVAKERAKADAMRNACEQAGTYVKSYSRSINNELAEDVIETMTANIVKLVEEPHFFPLEEVDNLEGVLIRVTVKVQIDDADIKRWLNKPDDEKSTLVAQMEALRKANADQERQIAELKRQLAEAKSAEAKEQLTQKFEAEDKVFLSNQKVDEAWKLWSQNDFNGAAKLFDEAIQLNPNNADAWRGRGTAYAGLKQYERAIQDYDKAIQLNPNLYQAYNNRGNAYNELGQHERAIQDYNKAIQLNPNYATMYYNRGVAYGELKQYEREIQDYDKAIQLKPNYANAYHNRGYAYNNLGQYERAIQDFDKALELDSNDADAYNNRGVSYYYLKQYERALRDFDKALEINPNHTLAKNNRAACLKALGR